MRSKNKKILAYTVLVLLCLAVMLITGVFFTYKKYAAGLDQDKIKPFSLPAKLKETAATVLQVFAERPYHRDYINSLGLSPDDTILDFGAGYGNEAVFIANILSKGNGKVTCCDIDTLVLDIARKRMENYHNADFMYGDITRLDIKENSFDGIVICNVLHCIDKTIIDKTLCKLKNILKKGGRIYIRESYHHGLSMDAIQKLMTKSGFKKISKESKNGSAVDCIYTKD